MKSVKGKFLMKLKTIKTIGYLKPDRILQVNAADGFIDSFFSKPSDKSEPVLVSKEEKQGSVEIQEPEVIDVTELMKDLEDGYGSESDTGSDFEDFRPLNVDPKVFDPVSENSKDVGGTTLSEIDVLSFKPPDLDSGTLFDPNLLAAFEQAVMEFKALEEQRKNRVLQIIGESLDEEHDQDSERPLKSLKLEEIDNPLSDFERICPPGGSDSVVLYTTGLRSIRKTFEDCSSIRFLLDSFRVLYQERDLSMHMDFRDELWRILGRKIVPPRLFIKGRYIGGAEEVLRLHEQGKFRPLLAGIPVNTSDGLCKGCVGIRFVVCFSCSGSRKVDSGDGGLPEKCMECNENGLIKCPICC
uniref:uncharacterized protein At3g28850-like n=1 Tax=Erigeron canadensis TaxID=72917 RepID=UPI001CB928C8|nr:uncharacterized protein At3g28850-like [Erigeron canadensis]